MPWPSYIIILYDDNNLNVNNFYSRLELYPSYGLKTISQIQGLSQRSLAIYYKVQIFDFAWFCFTPLWLKHAYQNNHYKHTLLS